MAHQCLKMVTAGTIEGFVELIVVPPNSFSANVTPAAAKVVSTIAG